MNNNQSRNQTEENVNNVFTCN